VWPASAAMPLQHASRPTAEPPAAACGRDQPACFEVALSSSRPPRRSRATAKPVFTQGACRFKAPQVSVSELSQAAPSPDLMHDRPQCLLYQCISAPERHMAGGLGAARPGGAQKR
jgi:hypothetical protein